MSRKYPKRTKFVINYKRMFFSLLLLAFIAICIFFGIKLIFKEPSEIIKLNYETIPITSKHEAIILRNETITNTLSAGSFEPVVEQADKIKNGQVIGNLKVVDGGGENIINSLAMMNSYAGVAGDTAKSGDDNYLIDENSLSAQVEETYEMLKSELINKNFITASSLNVDLKYKLQRLKKLKNDSSANAFLAKTSTSVSAGSEKAQAGQVLEIYSTRSGVISYLIDGLEETLDYENRYKLNYNELWKKDIKSIDTRGRVISKGQPLFKIIKTNSWYLACEVDRTDIDLFPKNSKVKLQSGTDTVEAVIDEAFDSDGTGVIILSLTSQLPIMYSDRSTEITLIREQVRGLSIPKTAIVIKNNQLGVYALSLENRLRFVPVEVIAELKEKYVVQDSKIRLNTSNGDIMIVDTIRHGDFIISSSNGHYEDEIIENAKK